MERCRSNRHYKALLELKIDFQYFNMDAASRSSSSIDEYNRGNRFSVDRQLQARAKVALTGPGLSSESPLSRRINKKISESSKNPSSEKVDFVTEYFNKYITMSHPIHVLDLGCADGSHCISNKGKRGGKIIPISNPSETGPPMQALQDVWIGIDHLPQMREEEAEEQGPYKKVYKQNLNLGIPHEIIIQTEKYNIIIAVNFLDHTSHHRLLFNQIRDLLLPEGHFLLSIESKSDDPSISPFHKIKIPYSKDETIKLLKETGFEIIFFTEHNAFTNPDEDKLDSYFIVATPKKKNKEKCIIS